MYNVYYRDIGILALADTRVEDWRHEVMGNQVACDIVIYLTREPICNGDLLDDRRSTSHLGDSLLLLTLLAQIRVPRAGRAGPKPSTQLDRPRFSRHNKKVELMHRKKRIIYILNIKLL